MGDAVEEMTGVNAKDPQAAVRRGAVGTFFGLLPLLASALGGWVGKYTRENLVHGTGQ